MRWDTSGDWLASASDDGAVRTFSPGTAFDFVTLPGKFIKLTAMAVTDNEVFASVLIPFDAAPNGRLGNTALQTWSLLPPYQTGTFGEVGIGQAISLSGGPKSVVSLHETTE